MACKPSCRLCDHLVISTAVTYTAPNLVITIPEGAYMNGEKYCIVVAQAIPDETTINAPVVIQIGDGTVLYALVKCDCSQATACSIRTRTRYSTRLRTNATGGTFKLLGMVNCAPDNSLPFVDGDEPT